MIRAKERVEVRVIRRGRVVAEVESEGNTLTSAFLARLRTELTSNVDVNRVLPLSAVEIRSDATVLGSATLTSGDVTIDDTTKEIRVSKSVTVSTSGTVNTVALVAGTDADRHDVTVVTLDSPVSVTTGDIVVVAYTGRFYCVADNLLGLLSDASLYDTPLVLRIYQRLANVVTYCMRVAKVEYVDDVGNVALSVDTLNDTDNAIIIAPQTATTIAFNLKTIRFCDSGGRTLLSWIKATALRIPANTYLQVRVQVA